MRGDTDDSRTVAVRQPGDSPVLSSTARQPNQPVTRLRKGTVRVSCCRIHAGGCQLPRLLRRMRRECLLPVVCKLMIIRC